MSEGQGFNVSAFIRDCWLAGLDEWHTIEHMKRTRKGTEISEEYARNYYQELDSYQRLALQQQGVALHG